MRVAVVSDSAANLPPELVGRYGIGLVPMYLKLGDRVYQDLVDLPRGTFYRKLVEEQVPVSTSGASIGDFREVFERTLVGADACVCVTVASFVSVTHASAISAAREFGDRVRVVDSKSASMGEGFVALEAARAAESGEGVDAVARRAEEISARVQVVATINTFEYLRRSGRVHALLAYAGTALGIKPVFAFRSGAIEQLGRPRSRARALERLVEEVRAGARSGPLHLAVAHADCAAEAEALLARIAGEVECVETMVTEFTPLMGAHTGPGVIAVCFWS
ncbi:MAG: DegV family protein [Acidobacteria bacterium]|nr:DegV family protein [Acidobacteriota bacterium]